MRKKNWERKFRVKKWESDIFLFSFPPFYTISCWATFNSTTIYLFHVLSHFLFNLPFLVFSVFFSSSMNNEIVSFIRSVTFCSYIRSNRFMLPCIKVCWTYKKYVRVFEKDFAKINQSHWKKIVELRMKICETNLNKISICLFHIIKK